MDACESVFDHSSVPITHDRTKRRKTECAHPVIHGGMCFRCCARGLAEDCSLPFEYVYPSLRLSKAHVDGFREMRTEVILGLKKLHLVLDLDHTLVHSVQVSRLTPDEEPLVAEADCNRRPHLEIYTARRRGCRSGGDLFLLEGGKVSMITKLRPLAREFLREASQMFELSIHIMGTRWYASEVAKLLDPDGCYFAHCIISREDCTVKGRKSLDVVLARESHVLIVDDSEDVWPDHAQNLLVIKPYFYFLYRSQKQKRRMKEWGWSAKDEEDEKSDRDEALSFLLGDLSEIHYCYFDSKDKLVLQGKDVRELKLLLT